ncbi:MAG: hypothetical protein ACE5I9_08885 [Candidatus Methylomirabilales bacterium]
MMAMMERKFRQAAITYVGIGIIVVLLTLGVGVPERKAAEVRSLIPGVVAVGLLGTMIYFAPALARRSAALGKAVVFLTRVFVVTSGLRSLNFLINFFGLRLESHFGPFTLHFHVSQFTFHPIFLVNAVLTALIASMLARAAWDL